MAPLRSCLQWVHLNVFGYHLDRHRLDYDDGRLLLTVSLFRKILGQNKFWWALGAGLTCSISTGMIKYWQIYLDGVDETAQQQYLDTAAYGSVTFLLGFIMAFRVQAAYQRFWVACELAYHIAGDLWDGASSLCSFSRGAQVDELVISRFHHLLVRLLSLLNALISAELEGKQERDEPLIRRFELLDALALDETTMELLEATSSKVELTFQWVQLVCVQAIHDGVFSVAPPILTRAFQDLGAGMVKFHKAKRIIEIPFPFPYMAALQLLLYSHFAMTPFVMAACTDFVVWAASLAFVVQFGLWFFVGVALEMDRPFGNTQNSIEMAKIQEEFNTHLLALLESCASGHIPDLKDGYRDHIDLSANRPDRVQAFKRSILAGRERCSVFAVPVDRDPGTQCDADSEGDCKAKL
eukprot:TRINITY_DN76896_c0_g1_i1.p1 TRINITY_DN76896_c0_g1~~TRINITY_DN76896_c0_g1_i1.p1  ORF type:complete len:410 (-),score=64.42 TRINITY_DN76896_c0_g1_i1:16-1245(-)